MTGYFLHSVTVLRVEARKPARGGNWFGSYLGKLLQEKQPKHVGSKARGSGNVTLPVQGGGEDVKWRVFSILGRKGMQSPPSVPWSAPETAKGAKVCVCQPLASFRQCFKKKILFQLVVPAQWHI